MSSAVIDYITVAVPIWAATVLTIGGCLCCLTRRLERRLAHIEDAVQKLQNQPAYYPMQPTAPPAYYPMHG
jgi:HAMP domain-containing protein